MRRRILLWLLALTCGLSTGHALALEVAEGVITTQVSERSPVDAVQVFPAASAGKLYCFTRVTGAAGEAAVVHVWYRNGVEVRRMRLPVRAADWRTWSVMAIDPEWTGEWKVEVRDDRGRLLRSVPFTLN